MWRQYTAPADRYGSVRLICTFGCYIRQALFFQVQSLKKEFMIYTFCHLGMGRGNLSDLVLDKYLTHDTYRS
jgi:hypothetical protein